MYVEKWRGQKVVRVRFKFKQPNRTERIDISISRVTFCLLLLCDEVTHLQWITHDLVCCAAHIQSKHACLMPCFELVWSSRFVLDLTSQSSGSGEGRNIKRLCLTGAKGWRGGGDFLWRAYAEYVRVCVLCAKLKALIRAPNCEHLHAIGTLGKVEC